MRPLGWALAQSNCVLTGRENLDSQRDTRGICIGEKPRKHTVRRWPSASQEKASGETKPAYTSISNFYPPGLRDNKLPSLWSFVMEALTNKTPFISADIFLYQYFLKEGNNNFHFFSQALFSSWTNKA